MTALQRYWMTLDEFLDWDPPDESGGAWDLLDGEPIMQANPTETHGGLQAALTVLIGGAVRRNRPECRAIVEAGVLPPNHRNMNYRPVDIAVTCAPAKRGNRYVEAPVLLVEILSPGNRLRTRDNVTILAGLPSVAEIVLVDSERVAVEVRRRGPDGAWSDADERHGPGGRLVLATIGLDVAVDEIYAGLGFD